MTEDWTKIKDAALLLQSLHKALKNGVKHYNRNGVLLTTELDILACLLEEGEITIGKEAP